MVNFNNILITGGCGFIGSNFINYIFDIGNFNIINVDKINYCSNEKNIKEEILTSNRYTLYKICISNSEILNILEKHQIDLIVHFAAQTHVTTSFVNTKDFIMDNIMCTYELIETVRKYNKLKLFMNISTDEVYGESSLVTEDKNTEETKLNPTNPYSATKASVEMIIGSYYYSYKIPYITVRCNNVFGPNQYQEKVIPRFIKLLQEGKKITIEGNGMNKRNFIHTEDVNYGLVTILENIKIGEIYNIGGEKELTILELAKILIYKIKKEDDYEKYIEYVEDRNYNDKRYNIDYSKLKEMGWKINTKFNEKIDELIKNNIE